MKCWTGRGNEALADHVPASRHCELLRAKPIHHATGKNRRHRYRDGGPARGGASFRYAHHVLEATSNGVEASTGETIPIKAERLFQVWVKPDDQIAAFSVKHHSRWVLEDNGRRSANAFPIL
ncbi:hypothetical protein FXB41_15695 [Bradyrhizobium canariense]|uniref:hypothetical protein n=1 Tax=Bradyrhizobium canariense TaxID=255045 RepID=UPI001CA54153|nr:hypothetical protein [Bradyrhizobium canariense]MBW5436146.1 hypothetical protein [Bradyrhizobium canariense]